MDGFVLTELPIRRASVNPAAFLSLTHVPCAVSVWLPSNSRATRTGIVTAGNSGDIKQLVLDCSLFDMVSFGVNRPYFLVRPEQKIRIEVFCFRAELRDRNAVARLRRIAAPGQARRVQSGGDLYFKRIEAVVLGVNRVGVGADPVFFT